MYMTRDLYCQGEGIIIVNHPCILGYEGEVGCYSIVHTCYRPVASVCRHVADLKSFYNLRNHIAMGYQYTV